MRSIGLTQVYVMKKASRRTRMKSQNTKLQIAITTLNLALWIWVASYTKRDGDYLGGPHLIALIATMLALLIWYRAVLANRQFA